MIRAALALGVAACNPMGTFADDVAPIEDAGFFGDTPATPAALGVGTVGTFGPTVVGTTSAVNAVVLDTGESFTEVLSLALTGAAFTQTSNCTSLPPGGACTVRVVFAPTTTGTSTASLIVTETMDDRLGINFRAEGYTLSASPAGPYAFAPTTAGSTSAPVLVTITNAYAQPVGPLTVARTGDTAQFASGADTCTGATLATNEDCTIGEAFAPTASGPRTLTVDVRGPDIGAVTNDVVLVYTGSAP